MLSAKLPVLQITLKCVTMIVVIRVTLVNSEILTGDRQ